MSRLKTLGLLVVLIAALVAVLQQRAVARTAGLRADSLEAVQDTTRRLLADSLGTVWGRRVVQAERRADSLDRQLALAPKVRLVPVVHVDTVTLHDSAAVAGDSLRTADFTVRQVPVTLWASVALPAAGQGTLNARVALDPIPLDVRVGCGERVGMTRTAVATVRGPSWATLDLGQPQATPDVCNAQPLQLRALPWWAVPASALLGLATGIVLW